MTNSSLEISPDRLQATVTRLLGRDVDDLSPLGSGAWSRAFGCTADDLALVVRVGRHVDDFERDRLASAFVGPSLPIPQVLTIAPTPELGDCVYACVSERATGTFVDDLDEAAMRALLPSLLATFDALRAVDLSHTTGFGGWDTSGNAPFPTWRDALLDVAIDHPEGRGHGWLRKLEDSRFGLDAWSTLLARLHDAVGRIDPVAVGRHVIHGDLLNYNMLHHGDQISAVFDWGCAMTGDPLFDLAWFAYWQPWYPAWRDIDFVGAARDHLERSGVLLPGFADRLRACMLVIAMGDLAYSSSIDRWDTMDSRISRALAV